MLTFDVAITTYRRPDYVLAAVVSCLNQGGRLRAVVVLDDAGGDDTAERLRELNDGRVECHVRAENGGMGAARHDVLKLCQADWVILLDSDWELLPGAIDTLAELIETGTPDLVLVGSRLRWDTGAESPPIVPSHTLDYVEQVAWRSRPDSLWLDHLSAISRKALQRVEWPPYRIGWHSNTLFFFEIARIGFGAIFAGVSGAAKVGCAFRRFARVT